LRRLSFELYSLTKQQQHVSSSRITPSVLFTTSMDDDMPTQEGSLPYKVVQVAARKQELKQALKEKDKQQIAFIADCSSTPLDDVVVDEESPKSLKSSGSKTTALQTIKGACIEQIGEPSKHLLCLLIFPEVP
jgi:hypothetical protein